MTASSIATIDELAPGRVLLGWGIGDTAVRLAGLRPARVKELEDGTRLMRALLDGESVEVGAARPARLPHHRPVPIWIAAGGPRTLRMAGGVADGVFIRVGTHPATSQDLGRRHPSRRRRGRPRSGPVRVAAIFHTVLMDDPARALLMGKSMAAGYYEYSPMLFDPPGLRWTGPDPETLKHDRQVWPDFHHAPDLEAQRPRRRLPPHGSRRRLLPARRPRRDRQAALDVIRTAPCALDYVVLHPIPDPRFPVDPANDYTARVAREILPAVRAALAR